MKNTYVLSILLILVLTAITYGQIEYLNDGQTHIIDKGINYSVYIDKDHQYLDMQTTVNFPAGSELFPGREVQAYNKSTVNFNGGRIMGKVLAFDNSCVNVFSGITSYLPGSSGVVSRDNSTVNVYSGSISSLTALGQSVVNITGGHINSLGVAENSLVNIYGGAIGSSLDPFASIFAQHNATVVFHAKNIMVGNGISIIDDKIVGTGTVSGQWLDGSNWTTRIFHNATTANIIVVPEPGTVLLLIFSGPIVIFRRLGDRDLN